MRWHGRRNGPVRLSRENRMPSLRHAFAALLSLSSAVSLASSDPTPPPSLEAEPSPVPDAAAPEAEVVAPPAEAPAPATARRVAGGEEAALSSITLSDGQVL